MVKKCTAEFKCGRESLEDDPRPGRSQTATPKESINKIHDMIKADRRVTQRFISTQLGISQESIHAIVHYDLQMTKISARCGPESESQPETSSVQHVHHV